MLLSYGIMSSYDIKIKNRVIGVKFVFLTNLTAQHYALPGEETSDGTDQPISSGDHMRDTSC